MINLFHLPSPHSPLAKMPNTIKVRTSGSVFFRKALKQDPLLILDLLLYQLWSEQVLYNPIKKSSTVVNQIFHQKFVQLYSHPVNEGVTSHATGVRWTLT